MDSDGVSQSLKRLAAIGSVDGQSEGAHPSCGLLPLSSAASRCDSTGVSMSLPVLPSITQVCHSAVSFLR